MSIREFFTRGLDGYDFWNDYATEELAIRAKKELVDKGYKVKVKERLNSRNVLVYGVYYRYKNI